MRFLALLALVICVIGCSSNPSASSQSPSGATTSPSASAIASASANPSGLPIERSELTGRIAFSAVDGIWVSDANGENRRQLTTDGGFDPTWSPDGSQIAYRRLLADDDGEIWIVNADGSDAHDLVNDPDYSDWGPAWSPDGSTIAYDSNRIVGLALWLMNADGSGQRIIGHGHGEYPAWSPDGRRLAYAGGDYYDILVTDADDSNDVTITTSPAYDMGPAWSPDGTWIAYHTQADWYPNLGESGMGPEMEIHLVHPDGTGDHRITNDSAEDSFAAWSPDGRFLLWTRHGQLVVARPDGSGLIEIGAGNFPSWIP